MSSKSSHSTSSLKRKVQASFVPIKQAKIELISQRHSNLSDDDIIRSRLLYEGDQGSDDRRILTLMKTFHKSIVDLSSYEFDKSLASLSSIEQSYRLLKSTIQMDEHEQVCYAFKCQQMHKQVKQLRAELQSSEERLTKAKQQRQHLLECNQRVDAIQQLGTRNELKTQQIGILERKRYFEHLQQTFETNYQQRLKQIAIYMRPLFELDEILKEDAHEDGQHHDPATEQSTTSSISHVTKPGRQRTYSDSSITSIDGDDPMFTSRSKKEHNRKLLEMFSLTNNEPQPFFSNEQELYGTPLVNPLLFLSSSMTRE